MAADKKLILERQSSFEGERIVWESHWQEIAEYMVPRRAEFTSRPVGGEKRMSRLYDTTAIKSNNILAAGMHGQLTSPATPWFSLKMEDQGLMRKEEVRRWLRHVEHWYRQWHVLASFAPGD